MYFFYGQHIVKWVTTADGRLALSSREQKASSEVNEQFAQENDPQHTQARSIDVLEQTPQKQHGQKTETENKPHVPDAPREPREETRAFRWTSTVLSQARALLMGEPKVWDSNPWLLGTKQGVIDLRTGALRTGGPDDHIRTIIPTAWKGLDEPAPRFERFLQEIFADREDEERAELIAFLQRALGYGITGHANEHIFLMLYGKEGHNGKNTLMHTLSHVLGKASGALPPEMLLAGGPCSTPAGMKSYLGRLQGKRLAWSSEPGRSTRFASEQIAMLTSGEPLVARRFCVWERTFKPSHLLILLSNGKPKAEIADRAFWERICPIAFNMRFVAQPEQTSERLRDIHLAHDLEAEASGILAWLVRGALEWHRLGLAIPPCILQAREECRGGESVVASFVRARCTLDPSAQTPAGALYKAYRAWASENALTPVGNHQFVREMRQLKGVTWQRGKHGKCYQGIALQE
jgi:P4 family phage/plasmid primase-like protien